MGADCKSAGSAYEGSNPSPATSSGAAPFRKDGGLSAARKGPVSRAFEHVGSLRFAAPLAQTAERLHGKEKVYGSIP